MCTSSDRITKGSIFSKTVLVDIRVKSSSRSFRCYCIIDEQSNTSLIDPFLINYFGLSPPEIAYSMITLHGVKTNVKGHVVSNLEVKGCNSQKWIKLPNLFSNNCIPDTKFEVATSQSVRAHKHVSHLARHFADSVGDYEVLLLVGSNCGPAMATEPYGAHAPFAHKTALGWALVGPDSSKFGEEQNGSVVVLRTSLGADHFDTKINFDKGNNNNCGYSCDNSIEMK